jgi:hypothetical protein
VAEPVPFELTGVGAASSGMPNLHSAISLKRGAAAAADMLVQWQPSDGAPDALDFSGELEPGRYTLNAAFSAGDAPGFTATNSYSMNLVVPEPAAVTGTVAAAIGLLPLRRPRRPRRLRRLRRRPR